MAADSEEEYENDWTGQAGQWATAADGEEEWSGAGAWAEVAAASAAAVWAEAKAVKAARARLASAAAGTPVEYEGDEAQTLDQLLLEI